MALKVKAKEQLIKVGKYAATYRYVMMHGSTKGTDSTSCCQPPFIISFSFYFMNLQLTRVDCWLVARAT